MPVSTPTVLHTYTTGAEDNRLHYLDYGGRGTDLICLHGVLGNAWNWHGVATGLVGQQRVLALDFRGYGESQRSASHDYTTAHHVADLAAVSDSLGDDPVDLIGSSWGALVALQYAAENPEKVGHLVVVDVEASFDQSETDLFPIPTDCASEEEARAGVALGNPNASPEMVSLIAATCFAPTNDGRFTPNLDPFFLERWPFRSDDHWERLTQIAAPTLFVHAADSFVNGAVMSRMAERVGGSRLVEVENSTHVVPIDNPVDLAAVVRQFLDG